MNKTILSGHATKDAELRYAPSGTPIMAGRIASTHKYKGQDNNVKEETLFIDFVMMGPRAEKLTQYINKGTHILIEGRLKENAWEKDGVKKSKMEVVVTNVEFMGGKKSEASNTKGGEAGAPEETTDLEPF